MTKDKVQIRWPDAEEKAVRQAITWPDEDKGDKRGKAKRQTIRWPDDGNEGVEEEGLNIVDEVSALVTSLLREPTPIKWPDEPAREKRGLGKKAARLAGKGVVAAAKLAAKTAGGGIDAVVEAIAKRKERREEGVEAQSQTSGGNVLRQGLPALTRDPIVIDIEVDDLVKPSTDIVLSRRRPRIAGVLGKDSNQIVPVNGADINIEGENG